VALDLLAAPVRKVSSELKVSLATEVLLVIQDSKDPSVLRDRLGLLAQLVLLDSLAVSDHKVRLHNITNIFHSEVYYYYYYLAVFLCCLFESICVQILSLVLLKYVEYSRFSLHSMICILTNNLDISSYQFALCSVMLRNVLTFSAKCVTFFIYFLLPVASVAVKFGI